MSLQEVRPGVYSDYVISSRYAQPRSPKTAGLVGKGAPSLIGKIHTLTTREQTKELLTGNKNQTLRTAALLLLESGVRAVHLSGVADEYTSAFALLEPIKDMGAIVSDAAQATDCAAGRDSVLQSSAQQKERLLFLGTSTLEEGSAIAPALNAERCVLTLGRGRYQEENSSSLYPAAALAGAILAIDDPLINLNGRELSLLEGLEQPLTEAQVQKAIKGGMTPFEEVGGRVECIRGITTRTRNGQAPDNTLRSINTLLLIDRVLESIRSALAARLKGDGMVAASLDSIASQVMVELAEYRDKGWLAQYQAPRVYSLPEDPEVCVVELAFHIAHVISQIHIKAHVRL